MGISWKGNEEGVISLTTIDGGRVVGAFSHFSHSVCVCLAFRGVGASA